MQTNSRKCKNNENSGIIDIIIIVMKWLIEFTVNYKPDKICIQPHMWKTVVDFRKNKKTKNSMVSTDVTTDKPTKAVAT